MATPQLLAGTAFVTVDGVSYELVGTLNWSSVTVTREVLKGMDSNFHGYKEVPQQCHIEWVGRDLGNIPLSTYQNMVNSTVTCQLANGKTLNGSNMVTVEAETVDSDNATFKIRFEGASVTEFS